MAKYPLIRICADRKHEYEPYNTYDLHEVCIYCGLVKLERDDAPLDINGNRFVYLNYDTPDEQLVVIFTGPRHKLAYLLRALARYTYCFSRWVTARYGRVIRDDDPISWQERFENLTVEYPNG